LGRGTITESGMFALLHRFQALSEGFTSPLEIFDPVTGYNSLEDPHACVEITACQLSKETTHNQEAREIQGQGVCCARLMHLSAHPAHPTS